MKTLEIINKLQRLLDNAKKKGHIIVRIEDIEDAFPELKESEDDNIRKAIINVFKGNTSYTSDKDAKKYIDWLEKQAKLNLPSVNERAWLYLIADVLTWKDGIGQYLDDPRVQKLAKDLCSEYAQKLYNFQVSFNSSNIENNKQEPTNKIKPKFHEGEWLIDKEDNTIFIITKVLEHTYKYVTNTGKEYSCTHYSLEQDARPWTINDAQDGDVLAVENMIFIYKTVLASHIVSYCKLINDIFESAVDARTCCEGNTYVHPATKEQCDLLFTKMKEAGYGWSANKKELKKIEQEPADTINSKFHEGDWIVFNGLALYIKEVVKGYYRTISKGGIINSYDWDIDNVARLWTIVDAKDGDVLAESSCMFIIKKLNQDHSAEIYCCLHDDGVFDVISTLVFDDTSTYPATKEQRDLLLQKMKEAAYTWDADKKELKKIEDKPLVIDEGKDEIDRSFTKMMLKDNTKQTPAWSREDEQNLNAALGYIDDEYLRRWLKDAIYNKYENCSGWSKDDSRKIGTLSSIIYDYAFYKDALDENNDLTGEYAELNNWLQFFPERFNFQSKQKWSEMDEEFLNRAIKAATKTIYPMTANWLKSLRERIQLKQEWSEEDNKRLQRIIDFLWHNRKGDTDTIYQQEQDINWLKSLRPHKQCKPTQKQLAALKWQLENTNESSWQYKATEELYNQLQEL